MKALKISVIISTSILILLFCLTYINNNSSTKAKHYSYSQDKAVYGELERISGGFTFTDYIYGGIVSHHLLAAIDIAKFYNSFKNQDIDTVILIGPNHEGQGIQNIAISNQDFITPWGDLETDSEIVGDLVGDRVAMIDEEAFIGEHSISAEAPYLKYYLPKVKFVPIVLRRDIAKEDLLKLANSLLEIKDKKIVVIASVDFSHHTGKEMARLNDIKSIQTISKFDLKGLYSLNIDSPNTIFVLLNYLQGVKATKLDYWQQNAADILNSPDYTDVTSYLFAIFRHDS